MKRKGGKRPGAGRPRGSTKPEGRIDIAQAYVISIDQIGEQAKVEGHKCNPVDEAYRRAYALDHPDHIRDDGQIDDLKHFERYCETQGKLRSRGEREFMAAFKEEEAQEALERRRKHD